MGGMKPDTREELILIGSDLEPVTRKEIFMKAIYDKSIRLPEPITREEWFLREVGRRTVPIEEKEGGED